jgi:hypothetical protein
VRRLSKSPAVLSVVLSIGLLIQGFVDHVSPDKIPLAVASTAATSIIGGVKSRTIGEENRPVLFRSLDEASWFFTEKNRSFRCVVFLGAALRRHLTPSTLCSFVLGLASPGLYLMVWT